MLPRESSLVWRLAGLILGGAGLVLLATLTFNHFAQRRLIIEMQRSHSDALTLAAVNNIETHLGRLEAAVQSAATYWALLSEDREPTKYFITRTLQTHPHLFGLAISLAPEERTPTGFSIPYGYWDKDKKNVIIDDETRAAAAADYQEDWFYLPYQLRRSVWSEPYFDAVSQATMVSFSVPVLRDGRVVAVVTGDLSLSFLRQLMDKLVLSKDGKSILLSAQGVFISHPDRKLEMRESMFSLAESLGTGEATAELMDLGRSMLRNESGLRSYINPLDGNREYINHRPVSSIGWALGVIVPEDVMFAPLIQQTRSNLLIAAGGLLLLLLAAIAVAYSLAVPLRRLDVAARQLADGHFDTPLPPVRRLDEVGRLTESFAKMRTDLRDYISRLTITTAAKEKIASELAIAHQIQMGIVPKLFPPFPHRDELDLFACLESAREVGGDLYDFALLDPDHLYVAIGDVSGKGVPASLLMAVGKTLLKSTIQTVRDPARALAMVNNELAEYNESCMFITAFCGVLNLRTGDLTYANAGQNPPLVLRTTGSIETLRGKPGPALAAMIGSCYVSQAIRLVGNDVLLLYTDGVTEAMNPANGMYDGAGRIELGWGVGGASMQLLFEKFVAEVQTHAAGAEKSDDITLLALRVTRYPDAGSNEFARAPDSQLTLSNRRDELARLVAWVEAQGEQAAWPAPLVINLNLALEEWFVNVVSYAFTDTTEHGINFRIWNEGELLRIEVEDDGRPFDPTAQAIPDTAAGLEQRLVGGLGIHFIRRVMAGMTYRREGNLNVLTLTARLTDPKSTAST